MICLFVTIRKPYPVVSTRCTWSNQMHFGRASEPALAWKRTNPSMDLRWAHDLFVMSDCQMTILNYSITCNLNHISTFVCSYYDRCTCNFTSWFIFISFSDFPVGTCRDANIYDLGIIYTIYSPRLRLYDPHMIFYDFPWIKKVCTICITCSVLTPVFA